MLRVRDQKQIPHKSKKKSWIFTKTKIYIHENEYQVVCLRADLLVFKKLLGGVCALPKNHRGVV